jgi:hypothetical protein
MVALEEMNTIRNANTGLMVENSKYEQECSKLRNEVREARSQETALTRTSADLQVWLPCISARAVLV